MLTAAMYRWTRNSAGQWTGGAWVAWRAMSISTPVPPCDCNDNGVPDSQDIDDSTSADINGNDYPDECEPEVLFVDQDATSGRNVGTSWTDAFTDLMDAIEMAKLSGGLVREIWVAEGVYRPHRGTTERRRTFRLIDGVGLYGGFAGGETQREQRDPSAHLTELNGEDTSDPLNPVNVYHVVMAIGNDETAILDGFTIRGGKADSEDEEEWQHGGGMFADGGAPTVANCVFTGNTARFGGGMGNVEASPSVVNCVFTENTQAASGGLGVGRTGGGAMSNTEHSAPTVTNCTFVANAAERNGGGIYNKQGDPLVTNCIFWGNTDRIGAVESSQINTYIGAPTVTYSCVQDIDPDDATVYPGTGNIDDDPRFADTDFRPASDSPCIDAADSTALPTDTHIDLGGNPRLQNHPDVMDTGIPVPPGLVVDMGAHEVLGLPNLVRIVGGADATDACASLIWPKADDLGLDAFEIEVDQPVLHVAATVTTTEAGTSSTVTGLTHLGGGIHRIELDQVMPVGHWTVTTLTVAGATGVENTFELSLGHLPGDVNEDGEVNMNDATAFGTLFHAGPDAPQHDRIDLNNDGQANLNDATLLGQLWNGTSGHAVWRDRSLPPKP